jgi:hypothetical protein
MTIKPQKDWAIAWILTSIWFGAVLVVLITREDIPVYLLAIATLFFLILLPSMKEMVRSAETYFAGKNSDDNPGDDDQDAHS